MTHVVKFLQEHGPNGPEELMKRFFIHHSRNRSQPSLILFKYDQLNSPMSHPIVQECRGIILDESMNWEIVVYPYSKFFNMREVANAAVIDWTQPVRAYEKIDGSLMTMYWNHGSWRVATSGVADASGKLHGSDKPTEADEEGEIDQDPEEDKKEESVRETIRPTEVDPETGLTPVGSGPGRKSFSELFWEVFALLKYEFPSEEDRNRCFMFELATPQNRVLIRHKRAQLYLHGVRNMLSLVEELPDEFCQKYGWSLAPVTILSGGMSSSSTTSLSSSASTSSPSTSYLNAKDQFEKEILPRVNTLDGLQCEGYVICDSRFNRFKLKCPSYVNLSLLYNKDGNEWKRLVAIVQVNEGCEFLAYFPQYTDLYSTILARYEKIVCTIRAVAKKYAHLTQKDLSDMVKLLPDWIRGPLFIHLKSKEDVKVWFSSPQRYNQLCSMLNPNIPGPEFPDLEKLPSGPEASTTAQEPSIADPSKTSP